MKYIVISFLLAGCMTSKEPDSLDNAVDEVLKHKQGVIIEITPQKVVH